MDLTKITEHIHRLVTPYKDIFTAVFFVQTPDSVILFDTASGPSDVEQYILPAMKALEIDPKKLKYIFLSHGHTDHAAGVERLLQEFPEVCLVTRSESIAKRYGAYSVLMPEDGQALLEDFQVVAIPGHSEDSAALLDKRTDTLITGDCLQLFGIFGSGLWRTNVGLPVQYLQALEKVRGMKLQTVVMAHDYHPYGYIARGPEEIGRCLDACADAIYQLRDEIARNPRCNDEEVAQISNRPAQLPTVGPRVIRAIREAMAEGKL